MNAVRRSLDERVVQVIAELSSVRVDEIRREDRLREDLGMDSVSSMELLSLLAEELHLDLEMEEALAITTVGAAIELAHRCVGERGN
jgi:acyl carrier protein